MKSASVKTTMLRAAAVLGLGAVLGGANPGHISGCDGAESAVTDRVFCNSVALDICTREYARTGSTDAAKYSTCQIAVMNGSTCAGYTWATSGIRADCVASSASLESCRLDIRDTVNPASPEVTIANVNTVGACNEAVLCMPVAAAPLVDDPRGI